MQLNVFYLYFLMNLLPMALFKIFKFYSLKLRFSRCMTAPVVEMHKNQGDNFGNPELKVNYILKFRNSYEKNNIFITEIKAIIYNILDLYKEFKQIVKYNY